VRHRPAPKAIAEGGVALRRLRNDRQVLKWIERLSADVGIPALSGSDPK
jgi:hypothetical protein